MNPDPLEIASAIALIVVSVGGMGILGMFVRALLKRWGQRLDFAERVLTSERVPPRVGEQAGR